jgi:hypothetical protein
MKIEQQIATAFRKVSESYTVTMCLNGYVIEVNGQDANDEWVTQRLIVNSVEELTDAVHDLAYVTRC